MKQPSQTFDGRYLYRTLFDKAAILLFSMIKDHPFVDGNKRAALTTVATFLTLNGYVFHASTDEVCCWSTILSVANRSGKMSVYGRIDIEYQGTEPVTDLERSIGTA
ncbi:MAG: type II toxin-antitoxin system death-on-curing family toxin, partial [Chloroflexi bacterium]|nr:type II toxin-antitoxin system death-on-curing family toxin [Chloroflexota bacterium]